jgi:hypothetical protein
MDVFDRTVIRKLRVAKRDSNLALRIPEDLHERTGRQWLARRRCAATGVR